MENGAAFGGVDYSAAVHLVAHGLNPWRGKGEGEGKVNIREMSGARRGRERGRDEEVNG